VIYEIDDAELDGKRLSFLAMEYVPGETLADWARANQPSLAERLELVQQVISACRTPTSAASCTATSNRRTWSSPPAG
jgi:hypothetical protein